MSAIIPRVIPCLLLRGTGLVKTVKFKDAKYLGDPRNVVKIFNDKEVDELILLDIDATPKNQEIQYQLIQEIVSEAFIPLAYGGGIRSIDDVRRVLAVGVEKIVVNSHAVSHPNFIAEVARVFGSSTVVVSIDVKKTLFGRNEVVTVGGTAKTGLDPVAFASQIAELGAGEIVINSVDRDGTMNGYDTALVRSISEAVNVPVIACGGAANLEDLSEGVKYGASAVAAGSMFVFQGKHRAVLISFPDMKERKRIFQR